MICNVNYMCIMIYRFVYVDDNGVYYDKLILTVCVDRCGMYAVCVLHVCLLVKVCVRSDWFERMRV